MKDAAQIACVRSRGQRSRDRQDRVGDVERARSDTDAGRRRRRLVARRAEPQHRRHEIRAERAVDPGGAQDHVVAVRRRDRAFAGELGAPVGADRRGRVVLAIGAIERPSNT